MLLKGHRFFRSKISSYIVFLFVVTFLFLFFNYKLLEVPNGITVDEAAFGYNAALLKETLHDENGRFLPVFVDSIEGQDWRQPITQYTSVLFFVLFGSSLYTLKSVSIFFLLISAIIFYKALTKLRGSVFGGVATLFFLAMPIIMIQSHLALDNIAPLPFVCMWFYALTSYFNNKRSSWLIVAGVSLGLGFYTYKAMRIVTPMLGVVTVWYLLYLYWPLQKAKIKKLIKPLTHFLIGGLPFALVIPLLEKLYPGAVFDQLKPTVISYRQFFQTYLSSFDPSFLFVAGDVTPYHKVADYGALLLASLPFFVAGLFIACRKKGFYLVPVIAFFASPALFGIVNSLHRASRLLAIIPFYAFICALGFFAIFSIKNYLLRRLVLLVSIIVLSFNYIDFVRFYWFSYNKTTGEHFSADSSESYRILAKEAKKRNAIAYIDHNIYRSEGQAAKFFEVAYFDTRLVNWIENVKTPKGSIVLSNMKHIEGMKRLDYDLPAYNILISEK